jgi:hypothetical protein
MISIEDLKKIARLKGLKNIGYAEKDYIIDIVLLSISRNTKDELVFKGGTCLNKFYKLDRFSEDLDFTLKDGLNTDILIKKIITDLISFGMESEIKNRKKILDSLMITIRTKGPLYRGTSQSLSNIRIDINLRSSVDTDPMVLKYTSLYPDMPPFSLFIMQEKEILAEKIRAIMTRSKARDVYDLWFLLKRGVVFDKDLANKKLKFYNKNFDKKLLISNIKAIGGVWETELKPLVTFIPDFKTVYKQIEEQLG